MCWQPKLKSAATTVLDPNAGQAAAEAEVRARRGQSSFASNLKQATAPAPASAASKLLFGQ